MTALLSGRSLQSGRELSTMRSGSPMLYGKQVRACALVLAPLIVAACGAENPSTPTPSFSQTTHIMSSTGFGAAPSACHEFNNAKAGAGTCSAPGQTLVEEDI